MPKTKPPATEAPAKRCKWCGGTFVPSRDWQEFDREQCRIAYHKNGPLSRLKMVELIRKEARRIVREELPALVRAELERRQKV